MRRMTARATRAGFAAAAGLVGGLLLAGCSSSAEEPPGLTATSTPSETTSAPDVGDADAEAAILDTEAAILDTYYAYWDAMVAAQRGNPDPALFEGVATGPLVEESVAEARQFAELGIVREGEPSFADVTVEVDGDTATVLACVDNSAWVVPGVEDDLPDVLPGGVVLERGGDDAWLVTGSVQAPAGFTC